MKQSPFGFDAPEHSPGFLLWQTTITWQRLIKKVLAPYDVSHAQFVLLANLLWLQSETNKVTQANLVNLSKLDKMTVSKSLKKCAHLGWIKRMEHDQDTRAKWVTLTRAGNHLVRKLIPLVEAVDHNFFAKVEAQQHKHLLTALQTLTAHSNSER